MNEVANVAQQSAEVVVTQKSESDSILTILSRIIADPTIDLDRMEKFLAMYERMKKEEARKSYNAAMALLKQEMPVVLKKSENKHTHSNYADLGQISKFADPVIGKHGFSLSFETGTSDKPDHVLLICTVSHNEGHEKIVQSDFPLDGAGMKGTTNKTPIQALISTTTYMRRCMKCMIFDIATKDDDGNEGVRDTVTQEQADNLREMIESTDANQKRFLDYMRVSTVEQIPLGMYDDAMAALETSAKNIEEA